MTLQALGMCRPVNFWQPLPAIASSGRYGTLSRIKTETSQTLDRELANLVPVWQLRRENLRSKHNRDIPKGWQMCYG